MAHAPDRFPILQVDRLHSYYGKSHILRGISFDVREAEIVSLLGRNGVGRSTLCKAIMGEIEPTGSILLRSREIVGLKAHQIARLGVGYVPENRDIFPTLTVRQNLMLGIKNASREGRWTMNDMFAIFPPLEARADVAGGALSGGEQQMLAIGRALMGDPDVIMVDEPTEGLAPQMVERLAALLSTIKSRGIAILLVEQKLSLALSLADRVYVMGHGRMVFEGTPDAFRQDDQVRRDWLEV